LIVVLTDGSHPAWGDGTYSTLLRHWGKASPVVVVSVVPPRLWPQAGLRTTIAQVRAPEMLAPNGRWRTKQVPRRDGIPTAVPDSTPVPVVEMEARKLGRAAAVVGGDPRWVRTRVLSAPTAPAVAVRTDGDVSATEALLRFRSRAEPRAYTLLLHLSAAPLAIRFIERVCITAVPEARRIDAAEILLSELVEPAPPEGVVPVGMKPEDRPTHQFVPGLRRALATRLNPIHAAAIRCDLLAFAEDQLDVDPRAMETYLAQQGGDAESLQLMIRLVPRLTPFVVSGLPTPRREAIARARVSEAVLDGRLNTDAVAILRVAEVLAEPDSLDAQLASVVAAGRGGIVLVTDAARLAEGRSWAVRQLVEALASFDPVADPVLVLAAEPYELDLVLRRHPALAAVYPDPQQRIEVPPSPLDQAFMVFLGQLRGDGLDREPEFEEAAWALLRSRMHPGGSDSGAGDPGEVDLVATARVLAVEVQSRHRRRDPHGPLRRVDLDGDASGFDEEREVRP
jgi:hypothetical protein